MTNARLLDLYTRSGSVAKVAKEMGFDVHVVTLNIDSRCNPDLCVDVLDFDYRAYPVTCNNRKVEQKHAEKNL